MSTDDDRIAIHDPLLKIIDEPDLMAFAATELYANPHLYRDLRTRDELLDQRSVRDLVTSYYDLQQLRITVAERSKVLQKNGSPFELVLYYAEQLQRMENALVRPLNTFVKTTAAGQWALKQHGIGPVLAAGLVAHIDISKAPTAGSVWRYAGLDPSITWSEGKKLPWNPDLKLLTWKIGKSFARFADHKDCFYGKLYTQDQIRRNQKNVAGDYAQAAQAALQQKKWKDTASRDDLIAGRLPAAQIDAQARRFAVKIFLSHYHAVAYQDRHCRPAPRPYVIEHQGGFQELAIPHFPFTEN